MKMMNVLTGRFAEERLAVNEEAEESVRRQTFLLGFDDPIVIVS